MYTDEDTREFYICDHCGRSDATVEWRNDPFDEDMNGRDNPSYWCRDCYGSRAMEVQE